MWISCGTYLAVCVTVSVYGQGDVRRPPSITLNPAKQENFRSLSTVSLACRAEGIPGVTYHWKKDGSDVVYIQGKVEIVSSDGNLTIVDATAANNGFYQCFAKNDYGTAVSSVAHIRAAFVSGNTPSGPARLTVSEGLPFVIPAGKLNSFPTPTYSWETAKNLSDATPQRLLESNRMQIACNGDLHFAYAVKDDELDGRIYKNTVFNAVIDIKQGGSYTTLTVVNEGSGTPPAFAPNITYVSKSQEVALVGGNIVLGCIFSGKPLATITWSRKGGSLPAGRFLKAHYDTQLTISSIIESDGGDYICAASNGIGDPSQHIHNVQVQAEPVFKLKSDGPRDVVVTEGDSITFNCSAFAIPEAKVVWFRNGIKIEVGSGPKRYVFSADGKSLTIYGVCRDCSDRQNESHTDLTVIQCNASNVHGYAFASGYLNVLLRTKVTLDPSSTIVFVNHTKNNRIELNCSAASDPSTPVTVRWHKVGEKGQELVHSEPPYLYVDNGNLTLNIDSNCSKACNKYLGEYKCVAEAEYSRDIVTVMVNSTAEPEHVPPEQSFLKWIIIGIAALLFLILLILICCIACYLSKGDEYDVDRKERKSGRNPDEELLENDFQDYYPNKEYDQRKGSGASLGSVGTFKGMDEYEDDDMNFREDGSFVGKYRERALIA